MFQDNNNTNYGNLYKSTLDHPGDRSWADA